jgi:hypothetical protein
MSQPLMDIFLRQIAVDLLPANVLLVAPSWATSLGPSVNGKVDANHYTTVQAALDAAEALTPTRASCVNVIAAPGSYDESVTMPACGWIFLKTWGTALTDVDATITGDFSYTADPMNPGNAGIAGFDVDGAFSINSDADFSCRHMLMIGAVDVAGECFFIVDSSQVLGACTLGGDSESEFTNTQVIGAVTVDGATFDANGCMFAGTVHAINGGVVRGLLSQNACGNAFRLVSVDATSTADIRGSTYTGLASAGGGINRSYDHQAFTSANSGPTATNFTVPYINAPTSIAFTQTSGTAGQTILNSIAAGSFSWTDTASRGVTASIFQQ